MQQLAISTSNFMGDAIYIKNSSSYANKQHVESKCKEECTIKTRLVAFSFWVEVFTSVQKLSKRGA